MKLFLALLLSVVFAAVLASTKETISSPSPYQSNQCDAEGLAKENHDIVTEYQGARAELSTEEEFRILDTYTLYYLCTAARLSPKNAKYWSDLAKAQLRMDQYVNALESFDRALTLDPSLDEAKQGLQDFYKFLTDNGYDTSAFDKEFAQRKRRHHIDTVPEYTLESFLKLLGENEPIGEVELDLNAERARQASFFAKHAEIFSRPFVIRNYSTKKNRLLTYFHPKNLARLYGDAMVDFYPQGLKEKDSSTARMTQLSDAVDFLHCPKQIQEHLSSSRRRTYIQWNLLPQHFRSLLVESGLELPSFFEDSFLFDRCLPRQEESERFSLLTHWKMLLIGEGEGPGASYSQDEHLQSNRDVNTLLEENNCSDPLNTADYCQAGLEYDSITQGRGGKFDDGAGMFLHRDALRTPSFQVQVFGKKLWHLCPGSLSKKLRKKKEGFNPSRAKKEFTARASKEYNENIYYLDTATEDFEEEEDGSDVSLFSPDYSDYPLLSSAQCYEALVSPGDLIYYPQGYYHQTHCPGKDSCVSISGSLLLPHTVPRFIGELMRECQQSISLKDKRAKGGDLSQSFVDSYHSFFLDQAIPDEQSKDSAAFASIPPPAPNGARFFPANEKICEKLANCYEDWWGYYSQ